MEIQNAKIKFSYLGIDEEGTPIFQLGFECKQGRTICTDKKELIDVAYLGEILNALEVRSWEELPRKFARIKINDKKVVEVGNLIEERWVKL